MSVAKLRQRYWSGGNPGTNSPPAEVSTTGRVVTSGLIVHQQMYRPLVGGNLGINSPPGDVSTTGRVVASGLIVHQQMYRLPVGW